MSYSQGRFSEFFASFLQIVKTDGGHIRVYRRAVNQNFVYFLMNRGKILHVGGRKHVFAMYRRYVPIVVDNYLQA